MNLPHIRHAAIAVLTVRFYQNCRTSSLRSSWFYCSPRATSFQYLLPKGLRLQFPTYSTYFGPGMFVYIQPSCVLLATMGWWTAD